MDDTEVDRWQPTRAGLCNVWRYADEVLTFHRGRLLLRGANGSGKSMALELLLPFVLDANSRPERLTSGTRGRGGLYDRLMAGADSGGQVGFLWVEFGAADDVFTIGVRVRASASTRRVDTTWFAAPVSIGADVRLLDDQRVPLSAQALKAALGEERVFDSGEEYRRVVRQTLFPGFDERQYDAMITTLLSLRREKISQDLSPSKLSEILTESLPPLDEYRLAEVAEGFERLDRRQAAIDRLVIDRDEMRRLARRHRQYARLVLASVVQRVRDSARSRDDVTRDERTIASELEACRQEIGEVSSTRESGAARAGELRAEAMVLRNRDAYKEGSRIEAVRLEAGRAQSRATKAESDAESLQRAAFEASTHRDEAAAEAATAVDNERRAAAEAEIAADDADGGAMFAEARRTTADDAERVLESWEAAREQAISQVLEAQHDWSRLVAERTRREETVDTERADLDSARHTHEEAVRSVVAVRSAFADGVRAWADGAAELGGSPVLLTALPAPPDEPDGVSRAVEAVAGGERERRAVERAGFERERLDVDDLLRTLTAERAGLVGGEVAAPTPPLWRSPGARDGRDGAPLWRVVDVAAGTASEDLDGVEAALVASGLLDAWVSPAGAVVLDASVADAAVLIPSQGPRPETALSSLLVAADVAAAPVPVGVVRAVLAGIAVVDDATSDGVVSPAVGRDGSFRLDPLVGRGPVAPASFLGEAARAERRRRRIEAIDAEVAELDRDVQRIDRQLDELGRHLALLESEVAALPSGEPLRTAVNDEAVRSAQVGDAERRVGAAISARELAEEQAKAAQRRLMQVATSHRLPTEAVPLGEYRRRVRHVRNVGTAWIRRRRDAHVASVAAGRAAETASSTRALAHTAMESAVSARADASGLLAQVRVLEETVGGEYRELATRIGEAEKEVDRLGELDVALARRQLELAKREGVLEERAAEIEARRVLAESERELAHGTFVAAVGDGLVVDAGADVELDAARLTGVTATLEAARAVGASLGDLAADDAALSKEQQRLAEAIHGARQATTLELTFEQASSGWWLLRGVANGLRRNVPEVVAALEAELVSAEEELRADEKQLFEETLSGNVRQAVADRLRRATGLIEGINEELAKVRTEAAGVGVRLRWEVDPEQPDAVRSARRLLLRDAADWTEAEREAMFAFFRARLDEAKATLDGGANWTTRLREALDYRHWHRFTLEIAHRDWEGLQPATQSRLARLSTGERSIALHLPMLASVAAHYDGAGGSGRGCPRLILLDELFAGVDVTNRTQLFGMFVTWDLDAVFTSDHEWCAYASLDGIAIHHLHAADAGEPVTTARFVWDGTSRTTAPVELLPA